MIYLCNLPPLRLGIEPRTLFVMFRTIPLGLVRRGYAQPDSDLFFERFLNTHGGRSLVNGILRSKKNLTKMVNNRKMDTRTVQESELGALAKKFRKAAGKTRAQVARELRVSEPCIFNAE